MAKKETKVTKKITELAKEVYNKITLVERPQLEMPIRSLNNVEYNEK